MYVFFQAIASHKRGGGGKRRANRRNGSDQRVAGAADGNRDLLRVTSELFHQISVANKK